MTKILVTGANGQLGSEIKELATKHSFEFVFCTSKQLDITDEAAVKFIFENHKFDYCINCAAYTAVDKAEIDEAQAFLVNAIAAKYLAKNCEKHNTVLIHISTDFVFDGTKQKSYLETDVPNPINVYGASKLAGEEACIENCSNYVILRTSWVYSKYGNNFVKTIQKLCADRDELSVVDDQFGSPTYAEDLAAAVLNIITKIDNKGILNYKGIYHYSNEGNISWFDFAKGIQKITNSKCKIKPVTTEGYPTPALRPKNGVMNKNKVKQTLKLTIPFWEDSLKKMLS